MEIIFPLLLVAMFGPGPNITEQKLGDIWNIGSAAGHKVEVFRKDGTVRKGMLYGLGPKVVMVEEGNTRFDDVAAADRLADGRWDGAIKGAMFGAMFALLTYQDYRGELGFNDWGAVIISSSVAGWAIDAAIPHREPLYRAALQPAVKLSLRF